MTGMGNMLAADGPYAVGGGGASSAPLSCTIGYSAGAGPFNVSGPSSNLGSQGYGIIRYGLTGGTPPYNDVLTFQGDPSGKINGVDNGLGADTISYTDFALNEVEGCYLKYDVSDSVGAHATARFPESGLLVIQRTS